MNLRFRDRIANALGELSAIRDRLRSIRQDGRLIEAMADVEILSDLRCQCNATADTCDDMFGELTKNKPRNHPRKESTCAE